MIIFAKQYRTVNQSIRDWRKTNIETEQQEDTLPVWEPTEHCKEIRCENRPMNKDILEIFGVFFTCAMKNFSDRPR